MLGDMDDRFSCFIFFVTGVFNSLHDLPQQHIDAEGSVTLMDKLADNNENQDGQGCFADGLGGAVICCLADYFGNGC